MANSDLANSNLANSDLANSDLAKNRHLLPTEQKRRVLIAGGAGFIGARLVERWLERTSDAVTVVDKLTYAAEPQRVRRLESTGRVELIVQDIADGERVLEVMRAGQISGVINLAAESHVDRSIDGPAASVQANVMGTLGLLEAARRYWSELPAEQAAAFRYLQVSTDEVYGSAEEGQRFDEMAVPRPSSPYAASKAAADHLVQAYHVTYGLPVLISHGANTYGPYQFPEKLIPVMIHTALAGLPMPIYGDGSQLRSWIHVDDHCAGLERIWQTGVPGCHYNVGVDELTRNLDVVRVITERLVEVSAVSSDSLIWRHVADRPGHDQCYRIDATRLRSELGWEPCWHWTEGVRATVDWYLAHRDWLEDRVREDGGYCRRGRARADVPS